MRLPLLLFGLLLIAGGLCVNRGHSSQKSVLPRASLQTERSFKFELQGAGSCAAMACHNADAVSGFLGREYRISLERDFTGEFARVKDKHAQAFAVLFDERSQRMLRQWKGLPAEKDVHPEREALCLRCHVNPGYDPDRPGYNRHPVRVAHDDVPQFRLEDGVSCEACHGPAERWLNTHFRKELPFAVRTEGMTDTRSVLGRVKICVDCHVGSAHAEVNHDLIAAGHPWLKFEAADYHARWHKHWDIAKDKNPSLSARAKADFEARLWVVGQVASAKAALELLVERARDTKRPWPEFAEHDCFACHHDLKTAPRRSVGEALGAPGWNTWHTAMLPSALAMTNDSATMNNTLKELRQVMATWRPARAEVAARAEQVVRALDGWLTQWEQTEPTAVPLDVLTRSLLDPSTTRTADAWTDAAQFQHALAGLERSRKDQRLPAATWSPQMPRLQMLLRIPPGFDSPRTYDAAAVRKLIATMQAGRQN